LKQIRKRLTYANVMSSIAVFLMLGGATAFAATKIGANQLKSNSVKTGKIVKEAVTTAKLKKNAVTNAKIADNSVTGAKVLDGSLTGADINAGTLGTVPNANNANTVGGNTVKAINFSGNPAIAPTQILNLDGFTLTASCEAGAVLQVVANGPNGSRVQSIGASGEKSVDGILNDELKPTSNTKLLPTQDDVVVGQTHLYFGANGRNVVVLWNVESFVGINPQCEFTGYAIG
jgi:hypothetical protein